MMKGFRKLVSVLLVLAVVVSMMVSASALSIADFTSPDTLENYAYAYVAQEGSKEYAYVSYKNVFDVENKHNLDENDQQFGLYTTLTEASFAEDKKLSSIDGVYKDGKLNLKRWKIQQRSVSDDTDIINTDSGSLYVGGDTVFFIYLHYPNNTYNVISLTGIDSLPHMVVANYGTNGRYGIVNCYGVPSTNPGSRDAAVVVFELDVTKEGAGLPDLYVSKWLYVYSIDSSKKNDCQVVNAVNVGGELVTVYNDSYYGFIDQATDVGRWYAYYTSPDAECSEHNIHVVLRTGEDWNKDFGYAGVYDYNYYLGAWNIQSLDVYHDGFRLVNFVGGNTNWADMNDTKYYMYCDSVGEDYNNDEIFQADYEKLEDTVYENTEQYTWSLVYKVRNDGRLTAVAVIIRNRDVMTSVEYGKLAHVYGVSE